MASDRQLILTDQGKIIFKEGKAGGASGVTVQAPAALAGDYTLTLPTALPGSTLFLQSDSSGNLSYAASTATLDSAYDNGSVITGDAGPVEVTGAGGFQSTHTTPRYLFETTNAAEYNWMIEARTNILAIFRGDQDADVSDDTFDNILTVDGVGRMLGINNSSPSTTCHFVDAATAKVRIQSATANDSTVQFNEDTTTRWEVGYDQSEGGLVVGRLSFANPAVLVEDTTGDVGVGDIDPDARLHVTSGAELTLLVEATVANARLNLRDSASTDQNQVGIVAVGDDLRLMAGATETLHVDGTDDRVGIGQTDPSAKLDIVQAANVIALEVNKSGIGAGTACLVVNSGTGFGFNIQQQGVGTAFFLDQNTNSIGLDIDSEATSQPLINLQPVSGNDRGDIAFGAVRTAGDPSTPSEGDVWYSPGSENLSLRCDGLTVRLGGRFSVQTGTNVTATVASGVLTVGQSKIEIIAEGGGPTDDVDTITPSPDPSETAFLLLTATSGDTITLKNGTGNLKLNGSDIVLNTVNDNALLFRLGSNWVELTRAVSVAA